MPPSSPPPKPPPAGWYPDPDSGGLRWWDGERWTEHVNAAEGLSGSQPPPGAEPPTGGQPPGKGRRLPAGRPGAVLLTAAALLVVAGIVVAARSVLGGDSKAAYNECQRDVQPIFAAMQNLGSHLDVGVNQGDYASEVGDVKATYDRLTGKQPATACQPVVGALGEAMSDYTEASSEWNECIFSEEEECGEAGVQELWSEADRAIATAKRRLDSLSGGAGAIAAAESEAVQIEADALAKEQIHSAQVAIETYATDHDGSYEGATPAKLRQIEPTLPPSLQVLESGHEYFSLSVASKGGNWFELDHEVLGELVYKCGTRGRAGCPESGEWG